MSEKDRTEQEGNDTSEGIDRDKYGIDLSVIDEDRLSDGEQDIVAVYRADIGTRGKEPAMLIVSLVHMIQARHLNERR